MDFSSRANNQKLVDYKAAYLKELIDSKAEAKAARTVVVKKKAAKPTKPAKQAVELVDEVGCEGDEASPVELDTPATSGENEIQEQTPEKRSNEETTDKATGKCARANLFEKS